jgi:hypothetical protein
MSAAPTAGWQHHAGPRQARRRPAGSRRRCSRSPTEVLDHLAVGALRQADDGDDVARVVAHEDDVGGLDGDVGAGADGDADIGLGQGGRVVDAVADHRHRRALGLQLADLGGLVAGEDLGEVLLDPEVLRHPGRDARVVAGQHHGPHAALAQVAGPPRATRRGRRRRVRGRRRAAVDEHEDDGLAGLGQLPEPLLVGKLDALLPQ